MRRRDPDELVADPVGGYVRGRSFVVWVQSPHRLGASHRSPLDLQDQSIANLLVTLPVHAQLAAPYDVFHDLSGVDVFDRSAFDYAWKFLDSWVEMIAARTRRVAIVRPTGMAGAAFTGMFHDWVQPRFARSKLCEDRDDACAWLEIDDRDRREIDSVHAELFQPELLRQVADVLARDLREATVERLASTLALSIRSLQRRLTELGTSFSDELATARMRAAETLLLDAATKIETVGHEVGFRSAPAFTAMFTRVHGESPRAFRERSRSE